MAESATAVERGLVVREPGRFEQDPRGHRRRRRTIEIALAVGVPIALIVLWQIASTQGWIDRRLYPAPTDIIDETRTQFDQQDRWHDVWVSTRRILLGYAWGAGFGLLFGYLMGMGRLVRVALDRLGAPATKKSADFSALRQRRVLSAPRGSSTAPHVHRADWPQPARVAVRTDVCGVGRHPPV